MTSRRYLNVPIVCACLTLGASASLFQTPSWAEEPMPGVGKVELANESVTVLRMRMAPHEKIPMHDIASARLVIWLTDAHLKDTGPDGTATEYHRHRGSIDWITPRRHMGENLSDQTLEFLAIVPKDIAASRPHATSHR